MAKYDLYSASRQSTSSANPFTRTINVLFEDGDNTTEVIEAADLLLGVMDDPSATTVEDALLAMPRTESIEILKRVWLSQMQALGNDKYDYANQLRAAVNYAQNG